jgi:hypothetical protein
MRLNGKDNSIKRPLQNKILHFPGQISAYMKAYPRAAFIMRSTPKDSAEQKYIVSGHKIFSAFTNICLESTNPGAFPDTTKRTFIIQAFGSALMAYTELTDLTQFSNSRLDFRKIRFTIGSKNEVKDTLFVNVAPNSIVFGKPISILTGGMTRKAVPAEMINVPRKVLREAQQYYADPDAGYEYLFNEPKIYDLLAYRYPTA